MSNSAFSIRARLASGKPFLFPWLAMPGAAQAGQIARLPFDAVALDLQHGMMDASDAVSMISAIVAAGKPAIVRTLWNDPGLVGQALDMGASSIIVPMVNSKGRSRGVGALRQVSSSWVAQLGWLSDGASGRCHGWGVFERRK